MPRSVAHAQVVPPDVQLAKVSATAQEYGRGVDFSHFLLTFDKKPLAGSTN